MSESETDRELFSFMMSTGAPCSACQNLVPFNGITEEVDCPSCGNRVQLPRELWTKVFEPKYFFGATHMSEEGVGGDGQVLGRLSYRFGRREPRCASCDHPQSLESLVNHVDQGGVPCPQCRAWVSVRPAPELAKALYGAAEYIVGEQLPDSAGRALDRERKPVSFACVQCGGGLSVDGSARTVECPYCQSSNYLPDGLWRELNPVPVMSEYYVVWDLDSKAHKVEGARAILEHLKDKSSRPGKEKDLGHAQASILLYFGDDEDRDDVLRNLSVPAEAFARFLSMIENFGAIDDDELLGRIAAHRNFPAEELPRLHALANDVTAVEQARRRRRRRNVYSEIAAVPFVIGYFGWPVLLAAFIAWRVC